MKSITLLLGFIFLIAATAFGQGSGTPTIQTTSDTVQCDDNCGKRTVICTCQGNYAKASCGCEKIGNQWVPSDLCDCTGRNPIHFEVIEEGAVGMRTNWSPKIGLAVLGLFLGGLGFAFYRLRARKG